MKYPLMLFAAVVVLLNACKTETTDTPTQTIQIGGLFSLTGSWSGLGLTSKEAIKIAVDDVNAYMSSINSSYRFSTQVSDTKLDTGLALQALMDLNTKQQIKYFIGPQSSAEMGALKAYAEANKLLLVSQGSTASSLSLPGDALFRFCPGDAVEGAAMAKSIFQEGKRNIITLSRDDAGNKGLQNVVGSTFTSLGGTVTALTPYATNTSDFSSLIATLKQTIQTQLSTKDSSEIGVYIASFDELKDLFEQANNEPVLSKVKWYGGDGIALSSVITGSATASAFAAKTSFYAPVYGLPAAAKPELNDIKALIKSRSGMDADAYSLAVYDAVWVIALTIQKQTYDKSDFEAFKSSFMSTANSYNGLTGTMTLNANGDRSTGTFDYYGIVFENNQFIWKFVGKSE